MRFDGAFLQRALSHVTLMSGSIPEDPSFSIDTRTLNKGDIFIALEGSQQDGHSFVQEAVKKGAAGLLIRDDKKDCITTIDKKKLATLFVATVPDTLTALLDVATAWRAQFSYPVVGITGSMGKTSTREVLTNILDLQGKPYVATQKNHNSAIGLALSLLRMRPEHSVAIFEMGISKRGEMKRLVGMAQPTIAVITAIGHAHMQGLGSIMDIAAEKRDIFSLFKESNIGIIHGDNPLLANVSYPHPVIKFGQKTTNQIQARKIHFGPRHTAFVIKVYGTKHRVTLKSTHMGAVMNALTATAVAHLLEIPVDTILQGIQVPLVVAGRFQALPLKGDKGTIIDDCYNAHPESMKASLLALQNIEATGPKIAILGDMLELGVTSAFWHRQIGRFLRKVPTVQHLILVGNDVSWLKKTAPVGLVIDHVPDWKSALSVIKPIVQEDAVVFVKGSRAMGLDNLVKELAQ